MASYSNLYDLVDDFAYDCKRHIKLKEDKLQGLEAKVEEANAVKIDLEARIESLDRENAKLREEIKSLQNANNASLSDDTISKALEALDPKKLIPENPTAEQVSSRSYLSLASSYRDLYREFSTISRAFCAVRERLEITQRKATAWVRGFKQGSFQVNVDGEEVVFQRAVSSQSTRREPNVGKAGRPEPTAPKTATLPPILNTNSDPIITSSPPPHDLELAPTQSQEPGYDPTEPPQLVHSSSGVPELVSTRPVRNKRTDEIAWKPRTLSMVQTGSFTRPLTIKSEPSSDQPHETETSNPHNLDSDETQDLDGRADNFPSSSVEEDQASCIQTANHQRWSETTPPVSGLKRRHALEEMDINSLPLPRQEIMSKSKRRKFSSRGTAAIPSVAEDGEEEIGDHEHHGDGDRFVDSTTRSSAAQRVLDLLETPPPRPILLTTPRTIIRASPSLSRPAARTSTRHLNTHRNNVSESEARPEEEALRCRPLHRLRLEDFKLNPDKNYGLNYAYDEVIRNRSVKRCLPGCVTQSCCGPAFQALARGEIPRDVTFNTLSPKHRDLLEEFHVDKKDKLRNISSDKLYELLVEAKAWELSNRFGRHRYTHGRAASPPGFWRTDMPTSQEALDDREKAGEMERERVHVRYKEALRRDGIWKFADE
ncbi:uncharacterized protein CIMG_02538 [Coccidioides immitis RS]|uniref:DNA endonuclease activator Ctp1 C-terminal domain-containing protein n=2 Tax=Coccidioides immitis TaxID=5501 RepID=A0A0E1S0E2_COCIM|nr:uncharacterized protein CIMG_02538 [Coccidioides immitis RS]EAS37184.1 hypothetical protein CIMG_02538 [Coccidioides immitis RS]KMU86642.1 hypothetical protein CIHG_04431 [Coccidioides immitis H538.4]TPX24812.1 hypothetical protein DIZ76_010255 [Coccidioides immitis]